MSYINIPNFLTTMRIILIPLFVTALIYKRYDYGLLIFFLAAITDFLDGLIARLKNQQTELGKFLDPIADKFLLVTSFVLFAVYGFVPKWLTITVISRDVIIITGWFILYFLTHRAKVEPSLLGKAANASQLILLVYVLLNINLKGDFLKIEPYLIYITAFLTVISGVHYIYRGLS